MTKLILVGGFLGAGKTSLLLEAARRLHGQGLKTGLVTNDQAANLVDTHFLLSDGNEVKEVSGSCFCCNFDGFVDALLSISESIETDVIIAEPVGSCTDLSATLLQPIKEKFSLKYDLAPLTVLLDPSLLKEINEDPEAEATYIQRKQLEEADIIFLNKIDMLSASEVTELTKTIATYWPQAKVMTGSALTGENLDKWLEIVQSDMPAGTHLAEVDYDIYAAGEAAYAWLNATYSVRSDDQDLEKLASKLLSELSQKLSDPPLRIGHVKFLWQGLNSQLIGNITHNAKQTSLRKTTIGAQQELLTVNARVETTPDILTAMVHSAITTLPAEANISEQTFRCLIPGRPEPTHRYREVVS